MFKLTSIKHKYARGIKELASQARIQIGSYLFSATPVPTIVFDSGAENYYVQIPLDQVENVCKRLIAAKATIEAGKYIDWDRVSLTVEVK